MAYEPRPEIGAVLQWRRALQFDTGAARAERARLKRAASVFDALLLSETLDLVKTVRAKAPQAPSGDFEQRLVVLAMTLPWIASETGVSFARALGQTAAGRAPVGEERPRLSPARFGALLRAARSRDWDGLARGLRRASAILGEARVDAAALVRDVLFLNDAVLRRWTYDYWQTRDPDAFQSAENEVELTP